MSDPSGSSAMPGTPGRQAVGHGARILLGLVFLVAGLLKVVNPDEFARQLAGYGIIGPRPAAVAAPLLIALEITLGAALLFAARIRATASFAIALLLVFLGAKTYTFAQGNPDPCGCFGSYLQTSPGWGLVIDFLFIASGVLTLWGLRHRAEPAGRSKAPALAAIALLSVGLAFASPVLPLDPLVTRLTVGRRLEDLGLDVKLPEQRRVLVALLDLDDPGAESAATRLDAIAGKPGAPGVVALTPSSEETRVAFQWRTNPGFGIQHVDLSVLNPPNRRPLYRRLPRFFLVEGARVVAVYDGAPPQASDLISSETS